MQEKTVINMVWSWLISQKQTERVVYINGQPAKIGMSYQEVEGIVRSFLGPITERIAAAYDWDFIYGNSSFSTVVDTSEYTLSGTDDDCGNIISVRYGTGRGRVLKELNFMEADRREGSDASTTGGLDDGPVYGYTLVGESDAGDPLIQFFDSPKEVTTIQYRYRKKDLTLGIFDDEFAYTVRDFCKAEFEPQFLNVAERSLKQLISRYKPGGDGYETIRKDPVIEQGNIYRSSMPGGS